MLGAVEHRLSGPWKLSIAFPLGFRCVYHNIAFPMRFRHYNLKYTMSFTLLYNGIYNGVSVAFPSFTFPLRFRHSIFRNSPSVSGAH